MTDKLAEHPHPRVQYSAAEALYHLVGGHPASFVPAAEKVVARTIGRLVGSAQQRVQCQAFELLATFTESADAENLSKIAMPAAKRAV